MIYQHLSAYFETVHMTTGDLERVYHDHDTLFQVAIIIASGSQDAD
jgi:hypothetical protein